MIKIWNSIHLKRSIAFILVTIMFVQISHIENYRYLDEVLAAPVENQQIASFDATEKVSTEDVALEEIIASADHNMKTEESYEMNTKEQVGEELEQDAELSVPEVSKATVTEYASEYEWQDFVVESGVIEEENYSLYGYKKLTSDVTIKGNLTFHSGLDLNGYTLTVEGDVHQYGILLVNGVLNIQGTYRWQDGDAVFGMGAINVQGDFIPLNGCDNLFSMTNENAYMLIAGDFLLEPGNKVVTDITNGTIELKGDFTQKVYISGTYVDYPDTDFVASGDCVLELTGEGRQNIYVAKEMTGFQNVIVGTDGVEQDEEENFLWGDREIAFSGFYNKENYVSNGCPTTFGYCEYKEIAEDCSIIYGSCYYTGEPIHRTTESLSIVGNFIQNGDLYLEGASLNVIGDYRIQSIGEDGSYGATEALLASKQYAYNRIYGDFITQSTTDHTDLLTQGRWELYGNLHQVGEDVNNFITSDGFQIYLQSEYNSSNVKERHIVMDNPNGNVINVLDNRMSNEQLIFDNGVCINDISWVGSYEGYIHIKDIIDYSTYCGNVKIVEDITMDETLNVAGDLIIQGNTIVNRYLYADNITIEKGEVNVVAGIYAQDITFEDGSDSCLVMENEYASISCNDFYYGSNHESGNLTEGSMYVTGDFTVKNTGTANNFVCSENHQVYAQGSNGIRTVSIESTESCINKLYVGNGTNGITRATEGTVIHTIQNYSLSYAWEGIEGYTLEQDVTYDEDLILYGGTLDLNGHTLTVNGDFYGEFGTVHINGGKLIVNGDMNFAYRDWQTGEAVLERSMAELIMDKEEDYVEVAGDFYANLNARSLDDMTKGTFVLAGNVNIDGTVTSSRYNTVTETIWNGTSLHLNGTEPQTISGVSETIYIKPGDLIVENTSGLDVQLPVQVSGALQLPEELEYSFYSMQLDNLGSLTNHTFKGDITTNQSVLSSDTTIEGKLYVNGTTDLSGYTLNAKEINIQKPVTLAKGKLCADTMYMYNKVYMQQPEDVIETNYLYVGISTNDSDYMTDGNIYIKEKFSDYTGSSFGFYPSGNHTITFTKTDSTTENPVKIVFDNENTMLNRVVLSNKLNCYDVNREKEDIAKELILGYEDTEDPEYPLNLTCTKTGCYSVDLRWDDATDNMEVYRYKIYRNGEYLTRIKGTEYTDAVLKPETTYRYTVSVIDAAGNESAQTPVLQVDTATDAEVPTYTTAPTFKVKGSQVTINCKNSFTDSDGYVDYYIITRDGKEIARVEEYSYISYENVNGSTIKVSMKTGNPVYTDTDLEYGTYHEYGITAVDGYGHISEEYTKKVIADLPPTVPEGFSVATEDGYNIIYLNTTGLNDCDYYRLYKDGALLKKIYNSKEETIAITDKDVSIGDTHSYYVIPYNSYGTKGESTEEIELITEAEQNPPVIEDIHYSIAGDIINENLTIEVKASDTFALEGMYAYLVKEGEKEEIYRSTLGYFCLKDTFSYSVDVTDLKGEYELHTVIVDYCGNETEDVKTCQINIAGLSPVEITDTAASASAIYLKWNAIEGAKTYVIEEKTGDTYKRIQKTSRTEYRIDDLKNETDYTYRVVAYDENGIRGLSMEDVTVTTTADVTAPQLTNRYADSAVIATDTALSVGYYDDVEVATVTTYYRVLGSSDWILIRQNTINKKQGTVSVEWDKTGISSGQYEVKYVIEDSSGNVSEEEIATYVLDVDGPMIQRFVLTPKDWEIQLDWEASDESGYVSYEVRRVTLAEYNEAIESGSNPFNEAPILSENIKRTYFEEQISPKTEYVYQLTAYDGYSNTSTSTVQGTSIDNDIFAPEVGVLQPLFAVQDYALSLSAPDCEDNEGIASYQWDMGNGDIIYGKNCEYIYHNAGTYAVTLTVADYNGNVSTSVTNVNVGNEAGLVSVQVTSGGKALPEAKIAVCVNGEACNNGVDSITDSQGRLSFSLAKGTYQISAYKEGYVPKDVKVTIAEGEVKEVVIDLEEGPLVEASCEVHQMSGEEMEEAGIDYSKNQSTLQYSFKFGYGLDKMDHIVINMTSQDKQVTKTTTIPTYPAGAAAASGFAETTQVSITNISNDPEQPLFVITKTVEVGISWMKNIYQVDVTLMNAAGETFYLEDAVAQIKIVDGFSLAKMKKGSENNKKWKIGTLKGGEQQKHTWYIAGDKPGSYPLEMEFEGILQPFNQKISQTLVSQDNLIVEVGKGLHLYIYPEKEAYIGEQYYIQYKLANESDRDYYNVTTSFGAYETAATTAKVVAIYTLDGVETSQTISADTGANYYIAGENTPKSMVTLTTNDRMTVETLKAGESIYGTYRFQFNAPGDINREYYKLLTQYTEELNVNNTNVTVTIEPIQGHLKKSFVETKVSKRTKSAKKEKKSTMPTYTYKDRERTTESTTEQSNNSSEPTTPEPVEEVKDPINLMTGAFTVDHVVAAVAGATTFDFGVSYNSLYTDAAGDFGKGWYHNYEMRIMREGSMITLYQNPYEILYFTESEETANVVCGTVEDGTIILTDDSAIERTYYQAGTDSKQYRIVKNAEGYTLYSGTERYTFDAEGVLTGYVNSEGQRLAITKSESSLIIEDVATGKKITASFNEEGRIVSVMDAAGGETTFEYEGDCMTTLVSKNGNKLLYEYDDKGHILIGKEGDGTVYVENTFDEEGRVRTQIENGKKEEISSFTYTENEEDETTTVTMTNGDGTTEQAVSDKYGQGIQYIDAIGGRKNYTYNAFHDMTAYRLADGTGADYTYDSNGNIIKVVETTGKTTSYTYNSENRITRMVCNDGTDVSYSYNENGQVTTMMSGNGLSATYTYNDYGQVLTETSSLGTMEYTYEKGMLRCLTDYSGNNHYFTYDANGNVVQYIDGAGVVTDYKIDVSGRVTEESVTLEDGRKAVTKYSYDVYGKLTSVTDAKNNTTRYVYNEKDQLSKEIRPDGTYFTYSYDKNGNVTKIVCPDGVTTAESVYDAAGNALSLTDTLKNIQTAGYSVGGQLLTMVQANGGEIRYTYYANGLLESQTDANGNTTTLVYDGAGRIRSVTDGNGASTTFGYDENGNLSSVENALGKSITMEYNQYRKVVRQTDANGNVTKYEYDSALNCTKVTDAEGGVTEFSYDARGQIISMTKKGETEGYDVTLSMTYDHLGNVTSLTDGEGNTQRMEYDANSNLVAVYDAYGTKTEKYEYDCLGNCTKITDALGNVTRNTYDAMGNLVKQLNVATGNAVSYSYIGGRYLASSTDAMNNKASMTYDSMGNVKTLTNPNGGVTSYEYDLNGNLTDEIIGEDYHIRYTYNAQNLVASKTNSRDQQTVYSYDLLGRIIKQEDEAGIIEYTYDSNDNVLTVTETIGEQVNVITRTYDGLNRVKSYEDGKGNRIEYSYDKVGNLVALTYPNGKEVTYTYNKNCSVESVTDWNGRTTTYSYDKNGRLVETKRPNGTVEKREYDKIGQLTLILDMSGNKVINRQEYSYDASGNISEVKQLYNGELNFTEVENTTMTYDKNNRLLTYNSKKVEYDKDGNMTYGPLNGKMAEFVFDCRNRLIKAGDTSYEYDAENNRIAVVTETKRTEYVVNSQPELSQVLQSKTIENGNEESAETTYYYYGQGLLAQENSKGYLTYHFNNVGSTMAVTDVEGMKVASYNYSPYGELLEGEYNENIQFLYNGQYGVTTDGNGLYYMRARYYNVDIKRFINQDVLTGTLERISSLNRYSYVEGNPVSYLDPFGLEKSIYDEWHEKIEELLLVTTVLSLATDLPKVFEGVNTWIGITQVWLLCVDLGVAIGKAWEGVFENDYQKVDSSYVMMGAILDELAVTLAFMALGELTGLGAFSFVYDLAVVMKALSDKFLAKETI